MEITIKLTDTITQRKYIENEGKAKELYKELCKTYGIENVTISKCLSKFYL